MLDAIVSGSIMLLGLVLEILIIKRVIKNNNGTNQL